MPTDATGVTGTTGADDAFVPDPQLVSELTNELCDSAWLGHWDLNAAGLNTRPQAQVMAPAVLKALHARGYTVVRRSDA